jgi:hypothetical protein
VSSCFRGQTFDKLAVQDKQYSIRNYISLSNLEASDMKIFSKVILSLSLSAQVFAAPLEERQGTGNVTTIDAAVSRLLSRVLTEVYSISMLPKRLSVEIYANVLFSQTPHLPLWGCLTSWA